MGATLMAGATEVSRALIEGATREEMEHRLDDLIRLCAVRCPHMNEITLEDTLNALRHNLYPIEVEETIRVKAKQSIDRMLAMS